MRYWTLLVMALVVLVAGCSREVAGTAQMDPRGPATGLTQDGFGIIAGDPDAPVQIELYTEPQCSHCADLQRDFGDQMGRYINMGRLAVTYRPLTFLDSAPGGHSGRVSNALFLAAGPRTSAKAFQSFAEDLWANQDPGGDGPSNAEMATMARDSGVGADAVKAVESGKAALDLTEMADVNFEYLYQVDPMRAGTPTVYDLNTGEPVDIYDNNWLSRLMSRS